MHPVPVHRSRTLRCSGGPSFSHVPESSLTRRVTDAAVSGLRTIQDEHEKRRSEPTYRGMRTPGRHSISSSPKYSVPRMYCNGSPLARRLT